MRNLRIAELLFNRPLMIAEAKLNTILHVLGPRFDLNISALPSVDAVAMSEEARARAGYVVQDGVAIVGIHGPLLHRRLASDYPSGGPSTYAEIRRSFDLALADDGVREIVMDMDSPGGEGHGVFDLADHIFQARGTKPITAVVNESAYSAGYLLASAADRIIVPRTGGVGSIGVIATHADFSRAEDAAGITVTHVFSGARKADFSPHQPLSSEALATLQEQVGDMYEMFIEAVARNRGMSVKAVRSTDAGIFEGKKAVSMGLADEVAPVDKAINAICKGKALTTRSATAGKEKKNMTIAELKENHPALVAQIEEDARRGMIAEDEAANRQAAALQEFATTERSASAALVTTLFGEEPGKKFAAVVDAGLNSDQVKTLGISLAVDESTVDTESRTAILAGLKDAAPAGLTGLKATGEAAERTAAVSAIAAGGSKR